MRRCRDCETEKPPDAFYKGQLRCIPCFKVYVKEWARTHPENVKRNKKKYRQTPRGKQKGSEYNKRPKVRAQARSRYAMRIKTRAGQQALLRDSIKKYGLTVEDWARVYNAQDRKCAACFCPIYVDKRTHVDHNHRTGRVRALLCQLCNIALGGARDSVEVLKRLIVYLEAHCAD
jgi:hypothetical protein